MAKYLQPLWRLESLTASLLRSKPNVLNSIKPLGKNPVNFDIDFRSKELNFKSKAVFKIDHTDVFKIVTSLQVDSNFSFSDYKIQESLMFSSSPNFAEFTYFIDVDSDKVFTIGGLNEDPRIVKPNISIDLVSKISREKVSQLKKLITKND